MPGKSALSYLRSSTSARVDMCYERRGLENDHPFVPLQLRGNEDEERGLLYQRLPTTGAPRRWSWQGEEDGRPQVEQGHEGSSESSTPGQPPARLHAPPAQPLWETPRATQISPCRDGTCKEPKR